MDWVFKGAGEGGEKVTVYGFSAARIDGQIESLSVYQGEALLIVNTASKCGFTPQYRGLQQLYDKYREHGFQVLGFPCNQFGRQEPGTNSDIQVFCSSNYQVSFPMFSKIAVNGPGTHPLYQYLKSHARGAFGSQLIKWNFTKFLVDRKGHVTQRFSPSAKPAGIEAHIERVLGITKSSSFH